MHNVRRKQFQWIEAFNSLFYSISDSRFTPCGVPDIQSTSVNTICFVRKFGYNVALQILEISITYLAQIYSSKKKKKVSTKLHYKLQMHKVNSTCNIKNINEKTVVKMNTTT